MSLLKKDLSEYSSLYSFLTTLAPILFLGIYTFLYLYYHLINPQLGYDLAVSIFDPFIINIAVALTYVYGYLGLSYRYKFQSTKDILIKQKDQRYFRGVLLLMPIIMLFPYIYLRIVIGPIPFELIILSVYMFCATFLILDALIAIHMTPLSSRYPYFLYFGLVIGVTVLHLSGYGENVIIKTLEFLPLAYLYLVNFSSQKNSIKKQ